MFIAKNITEEEIQPGVIDRCFELTTDKNSIDLFITGCSGDGSEGQIKVAKAMADKVQSGENSLLLLTGDTVYPTIRLDTKPTDIAKYYSPYSDLGIAHSFAAIGNHECGAITPIPGHGAAYGNQELLLQRRNHAADIINTHVTCSPYYRVTCTKLDKETPFLEIIVIDSTTLHFDKAQQNWLQWVALNSKAKNTLLISHHAIGETLGKRNLTTNENHLYGPYLRPGGSPFIGNHHQVLEQVFYDLDIMGKLRQWTSAVAHDHFLAYVDKHPKYGNVIYSGGGSTQERTTPIFSHIGQQFPALSVHNQHAENQKGKTGGFAKMELRNGKLHALTIISADKTELHQQKYQDCTEQEVITVSEMKEALNTILGHYLQTGIIRFLLNPLFRFLSFNTCGHKHNQRAESLISAINDNELDDIDSLKVIINEQIKLVEAAMLTKNKTAPLSQLSSQDNAQVKHETPLKNATRGGYYTQLLSAQAYVHKFSMISPQPTRQTHFL
ncbi:MULTISPECIES: hypothetical protein [Legionella]|uniref:Calcineurin-like phosphoesterase domain-containing protein n=1 Tax=Legionella drozanskii LLAP-1 TaxID=1212489 RepID=A0A0W0TDF6_9GAMM|nr:MULTISPECIES: hypothetical protein [Legionella]KTC93660.1 hypothetical protein Ldro_0010 [Legionella drozanskii LLAP-1]PJE12691.1 MAG: hypothetical protein CK430_07080 [Legionella sp.]